MKNYPFILKSIHQAKNKKYQQYVSSLGISFADQRSSKNLIHAPLEFLVQLETRLMWDSSLQCGYFRNCLGKIERSNISQMSVSSKHSPSICQNLLGTTGT